MADEFLMKGKVYSEHKHKLVHPVVAEVKYDEIRLHVRRIPGDVLFLSYSGKPLHNLAPWANQFAELMSEHDIPDLDCGVLVNGNFNDSYRWTRSSSGIPPEKLDKKTGRVAPALAIEMVEFMLFDQPGMAGPYSHRRDLLLDLCGLSIADYGLPMRRPQSWVVGSEAELDRKFVEVREGGDEGLMVKTLDHLYECGKRIDGWLKMKPEDKVDGRITGINQAFSIAGEPLDRAGSIDVVCEDGSRASPSGIAHALGRLMLANPQDYIGQWCEFSFMERDRAGGYRHPSFGRLREAK